MLDIVRQMAAELNHDEKTVLLNDLKAAIAAETAPEAGDPERCPHCGCPVFVRKGHGPGGIQRWLCRGCARTFSRSSRGLLALSKLPLGAWMAFAECMADALPSGGRRPGARCCCPPHG